jgi:hypothetical protein
MRVGAVCNMIFRSLSLRVGTGSNQWKIA